MRKIATLMICTAVFMSCEKKDGDENFIQQVSHQVSVNYGEIYENQIATDVSLKFLNKNTSASYSTKTDNNGVATILIPSGEYEITATKSLTAQEAEILTGEAQEINFNGIIPSVIINSKNNNPSTITLVSGRIGNLIIKQIYYSGSNNRTAASFRDQFFEVHNNSSETIYLDGYCFAQIKGVASISVANTPDKGYTTEGNYDWSKADGLTDQGEKANTDYVYAEEVIAFPGSGKDYPLAPGKSVFVAQNAQNHKQPLTVTENGVQKTYSVTEPQNTIDLSRAQFEGYYGNDPSLEGKPYGTDIDNPDVPNMEILYKIKGNKDLIFDTLGRDAFVLFKEDRNTINSWRKAPLPTARRTEKETTQFLQIPNSVIIDGVHLQNFNDKKPIPRRLPSSIDSGHIKGRGSFNSESAIRKIKKTIGKRTIYQDTNNSTEDFEIITLPNTESLNQ